MTDDPCFRVLDAARACGVDPATLRLWLSQERNADPLSVGGLIYRRELEACLGRRDLALPAELDPWPKILVTDDTPDALRMVYWTLEAALPFALLRCASSGVEALDQLAGFRPHLVVTDLRMPDGIDGFALCERVAADRSLHGTKILVVSGDATPLAWNRAFERGAAEFLRKPVSSEKLAATVRRLLELPGPAPIS
jgi:CheY-like chemotaxis protein